MKTFDNLLSSIYLPGSALGNDSHNEYVFEIHKKNITFNNTDLTTRFLFIFNAVRKEDLSKKLISFNTSMHKSYFVYL